MAFYQFSRQQIIQSTIEDVWDFISSPKNLKLITPDYLGFDIISSNLPDKMYQGLIIHYKVSPILGIKLNWLTEITHIKACEYFVDEQRLGPYKFWHHQHYFTPTHEGVLMKDIVTYAPPYGLIGKFLNGIIIDKKLKEIFDYRRIRIEQQFSKS